MKEELITVTRDELEKYILQETLKTQNMLYHIEVEELISIPSVRESKLLKQNIYLDKKEWRNFLKQVRYTQMELEKMRTIIKVMEPVYRAYHLQYDEEYQKVEQEPDVAPFEFNDYIKMVCASYDADEFERTREMFEDIFPDGLDGDSLKI